MGTADASFLRNNNCKVPTVLYSCKHGGASSTENMPTTKESERYYRFNKSVTLFKANEGKYITQVSYPTAISIEKLPKVYRMKSSNTYRAKQGYTVTEGFLNRKSGIFGFVVSDYYQTERLLNLVSNKVNKRMIKRVIDELNWAYTLHRLIIIPSFVSLSMLTFQNE